MHSGRPDIQLLRPDIERDATFALGWFERPEGRETLLSMGNAEHEIEPPSLEGEQAIIKEFIDLEKSGAQVTRMIAVDKKVIGAVWVELQESHGVQPPSIHIMIGDPDLRGQGIGRSVMQSAIDYVKQLGYNTIYSRHLVSNMTVGRLNESLGFVLDSAPYTDENGLVWQNIMLHLNNKTAENYASRTHSRAKRN